MDETVRPSEIRERKDDAWKEKLRYYGELIRIVNNLTLGTVIVLALVVGVGGVLIGHWESPVLSKSQAEEFRRQYLPILAQIIENQKLIIVEQTKTASALEKVADAIRQHEVQLVALREMAVTLKELRCDVGPRTQRESCLRTVIQAYSRNDHRWGDFPNH